MRYIRSLVNVSLALLLLLVLGAGAILSVLLVYGRDLPDHNQLRNYSPPIVTRIHAFNGQLFDEVASENRVFAPISMIPQKLISGFIAIEDKQFYDHFGVNPFAIIRAAMQNISRYQDGRRPIGASTITQQVAKYFLLNSEISYERKIREAIIAIRLEQVLTKEQILELYLNEIYLGRGNYGVAAASLDYFDKSINELNTSEIAYLASLPKAPNRYSHPDNKELAIQRRNLVVEKMYELGFISFEEAQESIKAPLGIQNHKTKSYKASYFLAEVKQQTKKLFPNMQLSKDGLFIKTTLSPEIQSITNQALIEGLQEYDKRHGYRGHLNSWQSKLIENQQPNHPNQVISSDNITSEDEIKKLVYSEINEHLWLERLQKEPIPNYMLDHWQIAVVVSVNNTDAKILLRNGNKGLIKKDYIGFDFIHKNYSERGNTINKVGDILHAGDVILVEKLSPTQLDEETPSIDFDVYSLVQAPEVNGGALVMNVHTGRVLALQGGWSFKASEFNRATQAYRQTGSSIKPFVYAAAIENGMTPSSLILDAPFVTGNIEEKWKPQNFSKQFLGTKTMRIGLEKSLNTMTVRLAHLIGILKIVHSLQKFNISEQLPYELSVSLGSEESSIIKMAAAYSALVNNGRRVTPSVIDKIQDRYGKVIYKFDNRKCSKCKANTWKKQFPPSLKDSRELIIEPTTAYQITHMLKGVVERGTARRLNKLNLPIAAKTGTTNDNKDAWFFGLTSELVIGVYVGFDTPKNLGKTHKQESGGTVALPIFEKIINRIKEYTELAPFRVPKGIRIVKIDRNNGKLPTNNTKETILEAYKIGTEPQEETNQINSVVEALNRAALKQQIEDNTLSQNNRKPYIPNEYLENQKIHREIIGPIYQPFYDTSNNTNSDFSSTIY